MSRKYFSRNNLASICSYLSTVLLILTKKEQQLIYKPKRI